MKRIVTKEEVLKYLKFEFLEKNNIKNKNYDEAISFLVNDLYNLNKSIVMPLNEEQTLMIRQYFGILNNGVRLASTKLAEIYNLSTQRILKKIDRIMLLLYRRILIVNDKNKLSSVAINEKYCNRTIDEFNFSYYIKGILIKNNIYTIGELLMFSRYELAKMTLSNKSIKEIEFVIHNLNLKFIDELKTLEKRNIILKNNVDTILNSSMYWFFYKNNADILKRFFICYNLSNLQSFQNVLNQIYLEPNLKNAIKKSLEVMGLNFINIHDNRNLNTLDDYLNITIEELYINGKIDLENYKKLKKYDIRNLHSLSLKTIDELKLYYKNSQALARLIVSIHNLGIFFKDENHLNSLSFKGNTLNRQKKFD